MSIRIILTSLAILIHVNSIANDIDQVRKKVEYAREHQSKIYCPVNFSAGFYLGLFFPHVAPFMEIYRKNEARQRFDYLDKKQKLNSSQLLEFDELKRRESCGLGEMAGSALSLIVLTSIYFYKFHST